MNNQSLTWPVVNDAATALGASDSARLKWRQPGRGVPPIWRIKIADKLRAGGVSVDLSAFDALPVTPGRIGETA